MAVYEACSLDISDVQCGKQKSSLPICSLQGSIPRMAGLSAHLLQKPPSAPGNVNTKRLHTFLPQHLSVALPGPLLGALILAARLLPTGQTHSDLSLLVYGRFSSFTDKLHKELQIAFSIAAGFCCIQDSADSCKKALCSKLSRFLDENQTWYGMFISASA